MEKIKIIAAINFFLAEGDNSLHFKEFELNHNLLLPNNYKKILNYYDFVTLKKNIFEYLETDSYTIRVDAFTFLPWQQKFNDRVDLKYKNPPEFFPAKLVPFASNGSGDYICFDYRNCRKDPAIVFWSHESQIGKDVFPIANSFDEFICGLKSEDEVQDN